MNRYQIKCFIFLLLMCTCLVNCSFSQDLTALRSELKEIYKTDQKYRIVIDSLMRKGGKKWQDPEVQAIIQIAAKADSINLKKVIDILNQFGWLGQKEIGVEANKTFFVVIQHADSTTILKYFPLLAKSYLLGGTPGKYYALMLDRILVENGQKQIYGTQMQMERINGKFVPFPIDDQLQVDSRRKKVGLKSLVEQLKEYR